MHKNNDPSLIDINFVKVKTFEQLLQEASKVLIVLALELEKYEAPPEKIHSMQHLMGDAMKAFADVYSRLLAEGKVPENRKFHKSDKIHVHE